MYINLLFFNKKTYSPFYYVYTYDGKNLLLCTAGSCAKYITYASNYFIIKKINILILYLI